MSLEIGSTIGDYQIVQILGAGGMGKVYKVRNVISDRVEAMKVLLPNLASDPELADRFMREIKVQASLTHPNIAQLHTAQRVDNQLLMIMEFVEGQPLDSVLKTTRVPVRQGVDYVCQVLSALAYAHSHGVIHRDIKPANMMLTTDGIIKLMDFGIAKITADRNITQAGQTVGSLYYMSPEQIQGAKDLGPRSDLYSLGVSLYEIVTGARPFSGDSDFSIMAAHLQQTPVAPIQYDPNLTPALNEVILMSIAKDAERRFQTADAFRNALLNVAKDLPVSDAEAATVVRPVSLPPDFTPTRVSTPVAVPPPMPSARPVTSPMPVPVASAVPGAAPSAPVSVAPPPVAAAPVITPLTPQASSRRGLYMVIGSVLTLAIVIGAVTQIPKFFKTSANVGTSSPVVTQPVTPQSQPVAPQSQPAATSPQPQTAQPQTAQPVPQNLPPVTTPARPTRQQETLAQSHKGAPAQVTQQVQQQVAAPTQAPPNPVTQQAPAQPAGPDPAVLKEIEELRQRQTLMSVRMEGVKGSLNRLSAQQASSGLGTSGDLTGAARRMQVFMDQATSQLRAGDPAAAKKSLDSAERELEKLEDKFNR
jgi:serine/threonine-protein kinase